MKRLLLVTLLALGLGALVACEYDPQPPLCIPESGMCGEP